MKFHDFPGVENEILKFHDFPGSLRKMAIICNATTGLFTGKKKEVVT